MKHLNGVKSLSLFIIALQLVFISSHPKLDLLNLSGYKCYGATLLDIPVRLTASGGIECFSVDGDKCASGLSHDVTCRQFVAHHMRHKKAVLCQAGDYKDKSHWCHKAHAYFYNNWHCPEETHLGIALRFSEDFGLQCMSEDGLSCLKGEAAVSKCHKRKFCERSSMSKDVKCSTEDYMRGSSWCNKAFAYFRHTGDYLCNSLTGLGEAVRLSSEGQVQCLSQNGSDCKTGMTSDYQCIQGVLAHSHKKETYSCHRDDFVEGAWCYTAFENIFHKLPLKRVQVYRQNEKHIRKHLEKHVAKRKEAMDDTDVIRLKVNPDQCYAKAMNRLSHLLAKQDFKTEHGMKKLEHFFRKKFHVNKEVLHEIKRMVGNANLANKAVLREVITKIKDYVPRTSIKKGTGKTVIKLEIKCDAKFFKQLAHMLNRIKNSKNGLKQLHKLFKSHFEIKKRTWRRIRKLIKHSKTHTHEEVKSLVHMIKSVIPKHNLADDQRV